MPATLRTFSDSAVIAKRNQIKIKIKRVPDLLVFTLMSPIMFVLLFAYAFSWVVAYVGLLVGSPEVVSNASFMVIFPFTFIANTFVPSENLPTVLRTIAEWNPVSSVVQATREAFGNVNPTAAPPDIWPQRNPVLYSLIWVALILVIFVSLSVRQYKRAAHPLIGAVGREADWPT